MHSKANLITKIDQLSSEIEKHDVKVEINELVKSEEKYKLLAENSSDVIWQIDNRLRFTYVSHSLEKLTGFKPEEWIGTRLSEHTPSIEFIKMARYAIRAFKSSKVKLNRTFITNFICKDGSILPVEIIGNIMKTKKGIPIGIQGSTRDIKTRLLAEKALRQSEERYSLALDAAQEGIWDWELTDDKVFFSNQWKAQLGYRQDELEDRFSTWQNLLHPMDYGRAYRELRAFIGNPQGQFYTTLRLKHKDGTYRWIQNRSAAAKDENGRVTRMFGLHTDITNQINMEQALKSSEQKLKNVISKAQIILFSFDKKGVFTFSDGKGLDVLNLKPGELVGSSVFSVYKDYPKVIKNVKRALNGETVKKTLELNGLFFDTSFSPVFNSSNEVESVIGVSSNVTDHKLTEKRLTELNAELKDAKKRLKNPID